MAVREQLVRIQAAKKRLATESDVWVATASAKGNPHLVPLSLHWDGRRIVCATPGSALTARNIVATGQARLSLESTGDVLVIDAAAQVAALDTVDPSELDTYVKHWGWDPRGEDGYVLAVFTPQRMQSWNSVAEITGRTIMRDGIWVA